MLLNYSEFMPLSYVEDRIVDFNHLCFSFICIYIRVLEQIIIPISYVPDSTRYDIPLTLELFLGVIQNVVSGY